MAVIKRGKLDANGNIPKEVKVVEEVKEIKEVKVVTPKGSRPKTSEHFPKEVKEMKIRVIGFYTAPEYEQIMGKIAQVVDNAKQGFVINMDGFSFTTRYKKGKITGVTVRRSVKMISL